MPKLMTVDEFLTCNNGTDLFYELADGVVRTVTPVSSRHGCIKGMTVGVLYVPLQRRRPCRAEVSPVMRINDRTMWMMDIAVTCQPPALKIAEPALVVEIMTFESASHDLGRKLPDYIVIPSVREVWMIHSERRWVQVWQRDDARWIVQTFAGTDTFASGFLAAPIKLDEIYDLSGL